MYRAKVLPEVYNHLDWDPDEVKVRWSRFAGCKACPCSPGFVVKAMPKELEDYSQIITSRPEPMTGYEYTPVGGIQNGSF